MSSEEIFAACPSRRTWAWYPIVIFGSTFQTDKLFVGVMIITVIGVLLDIGLRRLERRFELWRPQVSG